MFGLMWPIGRPMSAGIRLSTFSAIGVKRRMRRSALTMTMAICTLPSRLIRSLLTRLSSSLRPCSSSLTVLSSSLVDCSSSFAVSSSSLVLCSSSLLDRISSLADCSSSLAASSSWMIDCRYSRLAASSRCEQLGSAPSPLAALRRLPPPPAASCGSIARRRTARRKCAPPVGGQRNHLERDAAATASRAHLQAVLADAGRGSCAPSAARYAAPYSSPSRAIFSMFRLASPGAGSRKAPVWPRNCTIWRSLSTTTPGGA